MRVSVKECNQKYGLNIHLPDRDINLHSFSPDICDGLQENQKVRFDRLMINLQIHENSWMAKEGGSVDGVFEVLDTIGFSVDGF